MEKRERDVEAWLRRQIENLGGKAMKFISPGNNGVPEKVATGLFGSSAVAFAKRRQNAGTTFNGYGIGDYTAWYLTEYGFYIAATYRNVERIREGDGWNE